MSELSMTRDEREAFLAGVHIAVVPVADEGRGPLTAPVWYAYVPGGEVRFTTGRRSRKAALMEATRRISLCVQTETAPYQYVTVEGPVTFRDVDYGADVEAVAIRYLGEQEGRGYLESTGGAGQVGNNVTVALTPERWLTVDYGKIGRV